ncbi:hypothetical protein JOD45_001042 [Scopulibacillus daqui]|uniref:Uncharacterized protein n=1 Tax=Scopulibacillus daqui TaxID=1469162 RepID=A0ABS2PZ46_9BACL|nr:hypothetical protein [Scopulibacillus daqui]MBM7644835.1 hypothetical protein [Scopulibacillus daqui]
MATEIVLTIVATLIILLVLNYVGQRLIVGKINNKNMLSLAIISVIQTIIISALFIWVV